jgi:type IV pilus assembly protein PilN
MRFTINLATRTYLDHRLLNRYAFGAIVLLLIVSAWNVMRISSSMGEQSRLSAEIASVESKLAAKPAGISEAEFSRQKAQIRFYNEIIERKNTNWLAILELFENVTPVGVSLSSLSEDKKKGEWKLEGHARSFTGIQKYVEKLESSQNFSQVLLLSHQNIDVGEKMRGVQFSLSCKVVN